MKILKVKKIEILYDHYKDSFKYLEKYLKQREKLFVYVLFIVCLQFLQLFFSNQNIILLNTFLEFKTNFKFDYDINLLNNILWFLLLSLSLRYFQINLLINRQYIYIGNIESNICKRVKCNDYIFREGKDYLNDYPCFLDWVHFLYTWTLPLVLVIVSFCKLILEAIMSSDFLDWCFGAMFFIMILITTILYLIAIHKKDKNN